MSKNDDALRCAEYLQAGADDPMWANHTEMPKRIAAKSASELRRLVAENEAQQKQIQEIALQGITDFDQAREAHERAEAQAALLRQAENALALIDDAMPFPVAKQVIAAIRQHLETDK